jgi:hypothetical protein
LKRREDIPGVLSIVKAIVFWRNRFPGLEVVRKYGCLTSYLKAK